MFKSIETTEDIQDFLDATNMMHDGHIIGVQYTNSGITRTGNRIHYHPEQTKLTLQILVTSLFDTTVEIEFEHLFEWQIKDSTYIYGTCVDIQGWIVWSSEIYANTDELKRNSYVIAESMKWRIVK